MAEGGTAAPTPMMQQYRELKRRFPDHLLLFRLGAHLTDWTAIRRLVTIGWVRRVLLRAVAEHAERYSPDDVDVLFEDLAGCTILGPMLARAHDDGPIRDLDAPHCPVRIAWGGSDRMIPFRRYGRPMMDAVPDAELVIHVGIGGRMENSAEGESKLRGRQMRQTKLKVVRGIFQSRQ